MDIEKIGKIIRKRRKSWGFTQTEAAGMCNVGVRFLSELENGKTTLQIGKVFHVLEEFGFTVMIKDRSEE